MYIELTEESFDIETKEGRSLVDFWAPWCGPCRMMSPVIDELAEDFEGKAKICKVNTDEQPGLGTKYGIRSIPTILIMKDGVVIEQLVGAHSKEALAEKLEAL